MKSLINLTILTALAAAGAQAQVPKGQGYVVQGFGKAVFDGPSAGHTAVGGEGSIWRGVTAGAEIGALYPWRSPSGVIGLFSASGGYRFNAGKENTKWDPFVLGGYSLFFRGASVNGYHVGGGVTYWFRDRLGLRMEFRNHVIQNEAHVPEFRIGLSFH